MVSAAVDETGLERRKVSSDPCVPLRTRLFRQRVIRDLANDIAAELPVGAVTDHEAGRFDAGQIIDVELLADLGCELAERDDPTLISEDRGIVEYLALSDGQLVEAGRDQCPHRTGQSSGRDTVVGGGETGEFDEEQRVAAAAADDVRHHLLGQDLVRRPRDERRRVGRIQRVE